MKQYLFSIKHIVAATLFIMVTVVFAPVSTVMGQEKHNHSHENGEEQHEHETADKSKKVETADQHDGNQHEEGQMHEEDVVELNAQEMKEFGIEVAMAGPSEMRESINLTGEINAATNRIAHLSPRFSGIVKEVRKITGDQVKKGEVIAIIESNESLVKYKLTSAISGTVIDMHMTIGENITDNTHSVTVADLSVVWASLRIYQEDLFSIKKGQHASIEAGGGQLETIGEISYISPVVDEETRTSVARVVLDNKEGQWKPGMFITAQVFTEAKAVELAVPKTAVMLFEGKQVVFVKDHDVFRPQPVTLGHRGPDMVEVVSGLTRGQEYISRGAFLLKAELQKGAFGHGHSH